MYAYIHTVIYMFSLYIYIYTHMYIDSDLIVCAAIRFSMREEIKKQEVMETK